MLELYIIILLHIVISCTYTCAKQDRTDIQQLLDENKLNLIMSSLIIVLLFSLSDFNQMNTLIKIFKFI